MCSTLVVSYSDQARHMMIGLNDGFFSKIHFSMGVEDIQPSPFTIDDFWLDLILNFMIYTLVVSKQPYLKQKYWALGPIGLIWPWAH